MEMPENTPKSERCGLWTKFSESKLIALEKKILGVLKTTYRGWFVSIGSTVGIDDKIWTVALNENSQNTPLVLLHGFAAGLGFWCLNLDAVAKERPVYALDLLGFGRSSRPNFSSDSLVAEQQMVTSIEQWRKKMNLERFILLGHSFGGYLATSYSINYPDRVKHLILVDPWGFTNKPPNFNPPLWVKTIAYLLHPLNPLAVVRAAGPMGPWLVRKTRSDISAKYGYALEEKDVITEYIYHCNAQSPTGESAFHSMLAGFAFAKNPMLERIHQLRKDVPMTLIYGSESWIDKSSGPVIKEQRAEYYVRIQIIEGAGHHIHADQPGSFNSTVLETCGISDAALDGSDCSEIEDLQEIPAQRIEESNKVLTSDSDSMDREVDLIQGQREPTKKNLDLNEGGEELDKNSRIVDDEEYLNMTVSNKMIHSQ